MRTSHVNICDHLYAWQNTEFVSVASLLSFLFLQMSALAAARFHPGEGPRPHPKAASLLLLELLQPCRLHLLKPQLGQQCWIHRIWVCSNQQASLLQDNRQVCAFLSINLDYTG